MPFAFLFALVFVISITALAASIFALYQSRWMMVAAERRHKARLAETSAALEGMRAEVAEYERQLRDLEGQPAIVQGVPSAPINGINLSRRSQALRMHRYGQSPAEISVTLGVPLQEVELLLKVHRIVVSQA